MSHVGIINILVWQNLRGYHGWTRGVFFYWIKILYEINNYSITTLAFFIFDISMENFALNTLLYVKTKDKISPTFKRLNPNITWIFSFFFSRWQPKRYQNYLLSLIFKYYLIFSLFILFYFICHSLE